MEEEIKLLVLENGQKLVSVVEEVVADIGEPNCKLINPFLIVIDKLVESISLKPWLMEVAEQNIFLISSDKILTITEPKQSILTKYKSLIKK
jgi:regulator of protease activity HflC (stomatin/prohibitin superfamily)